MKLACALVILLGVALHCAGLQMPFLGHFAQHQTDYATVVQRWLETGANPALPFMRFIARGQNRLFLGDLPINLTLVYAAVKYFHLSIETAGRGLSFLFFISSLYPLFRIGRLCFSNPATAWFALFFYGFSPLTIIYGQAFLLEITALTFGLWGYFYFLKWQKEQGLALLGCASLLFGLMLSTRIYYAPALVPAGLMLLQKQKIQSFTKAPIWLFVLISLSLPVFWQFYAAQAAGSNGDESSLSDNLRVFVTLSPGTVPNAFSLRSLTSVVDTVLLKMVTPAGFLLALTAILISEGGRKQTAFYRIYFASFIPLFLAAPRKFVEFDYYFLPFVPMMAVAAADALVSLIAMLTVQRLKHGLLAALGLITLLFSVRYSIAPIRIIPEEDQYVLRMGEKVAAYAQPGERVIASHGSSTSFLFYTNRDGWPFELPDVIGGVRNREDTYGNAVERLERFVAQGAVVFALVDRKQESLNPNFISYLRRRYELLFQGHEGLIFSLRASKNT